MNVGTFVMKRSAYGVFVMLGVSLLAFILVHLTGDPAAALLPLGTPPEQIEAFRIQAGLDQPIIVQFVRYIADVLQGDFGLSLRHRQPAMHLVLSRLPATLALAFAGLTLTIAVSVPLALGAAKAKDGWLDRTATFVALLGQTVPGFWLGVMLILLFGVKLKWLPVSGGDSLLSLILPAFVVAATPAGSLIRLLRTTMREVLTMDYIRTARAKGLPETAVIVGHGLKNALIPSVALLSVELSRLFGGALIAEIVFGYPGMGQLAMQAITNRDIPVIQSFVLLQAAVIVIINTALDLIHMLLEPKVKYV